MSIASQIALGGALTLAGLVASWLAGRRRGAAAVLRGAAWSLIPLAAALIGAFDLLWRFGTAIGDFAASFVFAPRVWMGVILAGGAALLFLVSGGLRRRRAGKAPRLSAAGARGTGPGAPGQKVTGTGSGLAVSPGQRATPGKRAGGKAAPGDDDELADVAEILRRRGIH